MGEEGVQGRLCVGQLWARGYVSARAEDKWKRNAHSRLWALALALDVSLGMFGGLRRDRTRR